VPDSLLLRGEIACPDCATPLLNSARFQWGEVPGLVYELRDPVRWLHDEHGRVVEPFTLHRTSEFGWQWNCGDTDWTNVILFDLDIYTGNHQLICQECHKPIAAISCSIRDGVFDSMDALPSADVESILGGSRVKTDIVFVRADGSYWPRDDWYDRPVRYTPPTNAM
jgi:hypothetical protein